MPLDVPHEQPEHRTTEQEGEWMLSRREFFAAAAAALVAGQRLDAAEADSPLEKRDRDWKETTTQLDTVWKEENRLLYEHIQEVYERFQGVNAEVKKNRPNDVDTLAHEWNALHREYRVQNEGAFVTREYFHDILLRQRSFVRGWEQKLTWDTADIQPEFDSAYATLRENKQTLTTQHKTLLMTDKSGRILEDYWKEKFRTPDMTREDYLGMLAEAVDTPEKIECYLRYCTQYTHDSPDANDHWKKGTPEKFGDFVQAPVQTIQRLDAQRKCMGDCDDFALLAKELLKKQGINALVAHVPQHWTCVWLEQRMDGRYDGYSIGTFGLDWNGCPFGRDKNNNVCNLSYNTPSEKYPDTAKGYATMFEALQSVMRKFERHPVIGKDWTFTNQSLRTMDRADWVWNGWKNEWRGVDTYVHPSEWHTFVHLRKDKMKNELVIRK